MRKFSYAFLAVLPLTAAFMFQATGPLKGHVDKLQAAKSLVVEYSVQPIGESLSNQTLSASFPNLLKWDSPAKIVVTDGKTIWTYDKAAKTYFEEPISTNWNAGFLSGSTAWLWSAFSDPKFTEQFGSVKAGRTRKLRGVDVAEYDVTFAKNTQRTATLMVDTKLGLVRGAIVKENGKDTLIWAEKLELGDAKLDAAAFTFTAPEGAKKVDPAAAAAGQVVKYSEVQQIFTANCSGCHGAGGGRGGLNLTSYDGVMRGGSGGAVISPGNPAGSKLLRNMKGQGRIMPPTGKLPEGTIAKVEAWIAGGAKND